MKDENSSCCTPQRDEPAATHVPEVPFSDKIRYAEELVRLPGGRFLMGTDDAERWVEDAEGPVREVEVAPFALDATTVTNQQFAAFIKDTGYKTDAEKYGWSYVFILQLPKSRRKRENFFGQAAQCDWWIGVKGATWSSPEGPGTTVADRMDHPAVHISWYDAAEFARWAGKRLPTEAEWEYASRGGLVQKRYPWGDELTPGGKHLCNIWQGKFPEVNRPDDGHLWTAPVKSYPPNGYGLYEMSGNVWEWCEDLWLPGRLPAEGEPPRSMRGGSFLCHKSYCNRYRVPARSKNTPDSTTTNAGFRCAADLA